jgi:hypothetical protein
MIESLKYNGNIFELPELAQALQANFHSIVQSCFEGEQREEEITEPVGNKVVEFLNKVKTGEITVE